MIKWAFRTLLLLIGIGLVYYFYPEPELSTNIKIDKLIVIKRMRVMEAYSQGKLVRPIKFHWEKIHLATKNFKGINAHLKENTGLATGIHLAGFIKI